MNSPFYRSNFVFECLFVEKMQGKE